MHKNPFLKLAYGLGNYASPFDQQFSNPYGFSGGQPQYGNGGGGGGFAQMMPMMMGMFGNNGGQMPGMSDAPAPEPQKPMTIGGHLKATAQPAIDAFNGTKNFVNDQMAKPDGWPSMLRGSSALNPMTAGTESFKAMGDIPEAWSNWANTEYPTLGAGLASAWRPAAATALPALGLGVAGAQGYAALKGVQGAVQAGRTGTGVMNGLGRAAGALTSAAGKMQGVMPGATGVLGKTLSKIAPGAGYIGAAAATGNNLADSVRAFTGDEADLESHVGRDLLDAGGAWAATRNPWTAISTGMSAGVRNMANAARGFHDIHKENVAGENSQAAQGRLMAKLQQQQAKMTPAQRASQTHSPIPQPPAPKPFVPKALPGAASQPTPLPKPKAPIPNYSNDTAFGFGSGSP